MKRQMWGNREENKLRARSIH